jgi:nitrogen-specific signal transduction histidine kinase
LAGSRWVRGALAWGGAFGLLVGVVEARAITSVVATEQAQLRAERLAEQQDAADYLNSMLRHEVLNSAAVIRGRAEILDRKVDTAEAGEHVEPVLRRSADIKEFVQQSRQLMESMYAEPDFESVDLSELLQAEATAAQELDASAEVVIETQSALPVEGDALRAAGDEYWRPRVWVVYRQPAL